MKKLRVAVVGAGRVSGEHVKAYQAVGAEVVVVCGRTKEGAQRKISELGVRASAYDNLAQLLERKDIDIVSLCSPPELHAKEAILAAQAGKHIAIEKPVALNREDLLAMVKAAQVAKVKTIMGFVLRWNDLVLNIKRSYLPYLGRVFYVEADYWHGSSHGKKHILHEYGTRVAPIGAFLGGGCHAVDVARFLVGSDIVEVSAITPRWEEEGLQKTTAALVRFENGVIGKVSATDEVFMPYIFNIQIFGEEGAIRLDRFYAKGSKTKDFAPIPGTVPDSGAVWHHPFVGMMGEFVQAIREDRETSCSLYEGVNTHLVCFAVEESARKGGVKIKIPRWPKK